jgi:FkbM family methyltransferase
MKTFHKIQLKGLGRYLRQRAALRRDTPETRSATASLTIHGKTIVVQLSDLEQRYLAADCVREPENLFVYRAIAKSGLCDTFIDIGANVGHVALSLFQNFRHVVLVEPNPVLVSHLSRIFEGFSGVQIAPYAVVSPENEGALTLNVPTNSSGLAYFGQSSLAKGHVDTYSCQGRSLSKIVTHDRLENAYVKVDVEGGEFDVLCSSRDALRASGAIVGFEALSSEVALRCMTLFEGYSFYCSRFDFLEPGGSLAKSPFRIMLALAGLNRSMSVSKLNPDLSECELTNFSQIFCVPDDKRQAFEQSVSDSPLGKILDVGGLRTWSSLS